MRSRRCGLVIAGVLFASSLIGSSGCGGGGGGGESSAPANAGALEGTWSFSLFVQPLTCTGTMVVTSGETGRGTFDIPTGGECHSTHGTVNARIADGGTVTIRFFPVDGPDFLMTGTLTGPNTLNGSLSNGGMIAGDTFSAQR